MKWIGLTGGIATGKSTAARALRSAGWDVVDADELARRAVEPGSDGLRAVAREFGTEVLFQDGSLDRKALGERTFGEPKRMAALEAIVHPIVRALCAAERARLERAGKAVAFYDVPLLFEKRMQGDFDLTVAVLCSSEAQLARLMARNGLTRAQAEARVSSQLPLEEKARRADVVLRNDAAVEELEKAAVDLARRIARGELPAAGARRG